MTSLAIRVSVILLLTPSMVLSQSVEDRNFARANKEFVMSTIIFTGLSATASQCVASYPQLRERWSHLLLYSTHWTNAVQTHLEDGTAKNYFQREMERSITEENIKKSSGKLTEEYCDKNNALAGQLGLPPMFRKYVEKAGSHVAASIEPIKPAQASSRLGYPEQASMFTEPPFRRPDLETFVRPASPAQVTGAYGAEFASLSRLGVVLVLVGNLAHEAPINVSRQSVRLTLPDGRILKPLEPSEMAAWLGEVHGPAFGKDPKQVIFGRHSEESNRKYETGILSVSRGERQGDVMNFRFPEGVASGVFLVEYVLDLGVGGPIPIKQKVPLNLRP